MHGNPYAADSEVMASILDEAVRILDEKFGLDYAKKNPLLLSKLAEIGAANYARRTPAPCQHSVEWAPITDMDLGWCSKCGKEFRP